MRFSALSCWICNCAFRRSVGVFWRRGNTFIFTLLPRHSHGVTHPRNYSDSVIFCPTAPDISHGWSSWWQSSWRWADAMHLWCVQRRPVQCSILLYCLKTWQQKLPKVRGLFLPQLYESCSQSELSCGWQRQRTLSRLQTFPKLWLTASISGYFRVMKRAATTTLLAWIHTSPAKFPDTLTAV